MGTHKKEKPLVQRIFCERDIVVEEIRPEDVERETLLNEEIFVHIDPNMDEWRHLVKAEPAKRVRLQIIKVLRDIPSLEALTKALGCKLDDICLKPSQIAKFVRIYGETDVVKDCRLNTFFTKADNKEEPHVIDVLSHPDLHGYIPLRVHNIRKMLLGEPRRWHQLIIPIFE